MPPWGRHAFKFLIVWRARTVPRGASTKANNITYEDFVAICKPHTEHKLCKFYLLKLEILNLLIGKSTGKLLKKTCWLTLTSAAHSVLALNIDEKKFNDVEVSRKIIISPSSKKLI